MDRSFLDWPFFEPRHRTLAEGIEEWAAKVLPVPQDDVDAACRGLVRMLGDAGWLRHGAGDALDLRSICLIREVLARHDALADFAFAMQGLGMAAVSLFGSPAQRRWLDATCAGRAIAAFALTEPGAGSDLAAISTTARREGEGDAGGWRLDGEKTFISNGTIADVMVILARSGEAAGARGLSAFLLPAGTPGLSIAERIEVMAPHPLARLRLDDVRLPADALIGEAGRGFAIAMTVLDRFRPSVGAAALGMARRALDEAVARTRSRQIGGQRMAALQLVQGHLAAMAVEIDAAALLVYRAAWAADQGADRTTREAAMAKLYATEAAQRVIDQAVQLFGGDGVRLGSIAERLYREIRALRIYEGASDVQSLVIARDILAAADREGA